MHTALTVRNATVHGTGTAWHALIAIPTPTLYRRCVAQHLSCVNINNDTHQASCEFFDNTIISAHNGICLARLNKACAVPTNQQSTITAYVQLKACIARQGLSLLQAAIAIMTYSHGSGHCHSLSSTQPNNTQPVCTPCVRHRQLYTAMPALVSLCVLPKAVTRIHTDTTQHKYCC